MKRKVVKGLISIGIAGLCITGCGSADGGSGDYGSEDERELVSSYEAEEGTYTGNVRTESSLNDYSGSGYAIGFSAEGDQLTITVEVTEDNFYDLDFRAASEGGYKENYVSVDGENITSLATEATEFSDYSVPRVYLTKGEHEVTVSAYWGQIVVDKLDVYTGSPLDESIYNVPKELVNANASDNAKRLFSYLVDNYGENVISGQYCTGGIFGHENAVIWKETGKFPAMVGLDMTYYSQAARDNNTTEAKSIDYALEAFENNTIVTMCWHWMAPSKYITGTWYSSFYKEHTNIDLDKIMNGEDEEGYNLLVQDMENIASELTVLRDADVPVLWRPLHEASGGWFWWGNCEAESYIKLYQLMYQIFTEEYELNNLIWVWNGQDADWYPGDEYVDIIGQDIYPGYQVYTSRYPKFAETVGYTSSRKIITLSENGCLFDPDLAIRDGGIWSYFGTWNGEFVSDSDVLNVYSEKYTDAEMLNKVYNHENVITRDELPDLTTYPME